MSILQSSRAASDLQSRFRIGRRTRFIRTACSIAATIGMVAAASLSWGADSPPARQLVKAAYGAQAADRTSRDLVAKEVAGKMRQWSFGTTLGSGPLLPDNKDRHDESRELDLVNHRVDGSKTRYLQYESTGRYGGINLDFTDDATRKTGVKVANWYFVRQSGQMGAIVYGERLAMGYMLSKTKNNPFIHYAHRDVGINLKWSDDPFYEWVILGGKPGAPVQKRDKVALFNTKHDNFMIFFNREDFPMSHAGDIGWPDSKTLLASVKDKAWGAAKGVVGAEVKCMAKEAMGLKCS